MWQRTRTLHSLSLCSSSLTLVASLLRSLVVCCRRSTTPRVCNSSIQMAARQGGVCVVGSSNVDLIAYTDRVPKIGETVMGKRFSQGTAMQHDMADKRNAYRYIDKMLLYYNRVWRQRSQSSSASIALGFTSCDGDQGWRRYVWQGYDRQLQGKQH
jgi:hypothetical protein